MLLAVDIGNTNISFGIFRENKLIRRFNISTKDYNFKNLLHFVSAAGGVAGEGVICSVVPSTTVILNKDIKRLLGKRPYIIGKDIVVPIKNLYQKPRQVGEDRLVNAYAGILLYGSPLIVVDFGTAITFDVISKNKEYLGGMILPGLSISLEALAQRTALLPHIRLRKPRQFIGRDTATSMLSGIVYGFASLSDEMVKKIRARIGKNAKAIGTGGDIRLLSQYCRHLDKINQNLTLEGLNLLYPVRKPL